MAHTGHALIRYLDYGGEVSTIVIPRCATLTAANFNSQTTRFATLVSTAQAIVLGARGYQFHGNHEKTASLVATSPLAQREYKWLITYVDGVTGKSYQAELPCPNLALLNPAKREFANPSEGAIAAFIDAWFQFVQSPAGNFTEITEMRLVGRNT